MRRLILGMTFSLAAVSPVLADSLEGQLGRCVRITGLLQRLACYDAAVKDAGISAPAAARPAARMTTPVAPNPAPVTPALASTAPVSAPAPSFGSESLPRAKAPISGSARAIAAGVSSLTFDATGHFTVALDNGQVWRQMPGDATILRQAQVSSVRIARSLLGNYDLSVPGLHATYRVVRVQ